MEERTFRIHVSRYKHSDLLLATSPDHKGFYVTARSDGELRDLLPGALRQLLEAEGNEIGEIRLETEDGTDDFVPAAYIAAAEYSRSAA